MIAEVTREETRRRAQLLDVKSYDISLDLTRGAERFGSTTTVRFAASEDGAATHIDLVAAELQRVVLNGSELDPAAAADGRISLRDLRPQNELVVAAQCAYSRDGTGLHQAVDPADGNVYTYTKFEPAYARRMFANFDQPDLKAEFAFNIRAPEDWTVIANQPVDRADDAEGGSRVWHFGATPRISTYLAAFAAGPFHVENSSHTTPRGQQIPLALACRRSLAEYLEPDELYLLTRQGLDFFTELFEMDYPFAKYDQVFVPEYSAGATENVGCVTISDELLWRSRVTDAYRELRALVIHHEMSHMWFGDLVTMEWWDDLWLNESFAEMAGTMGNAEATRFTDAWTSFSCARKTWGYAQDQLPSSHPIAADVPTLSQAVANFDGISYAKGASVLSALMASLGRDVFFAGIRQYLRDHAWGNATLSDLLEALERSAGTSLASWSQQWLRTAGPNTIRSSFELDGDGTFASFAVLQEAPVENPTLRPHHIAIGLYDLVGDELVRSDRLEIDLDGPATTVPILAGVRQPDLVLLNDDDLDYVIVRLDERSLSTLRSSVGRIGSSLSRAVCWTSVLDMACQAEMSFRRFVEMFATALPHETSAVMIEVLQLVARNEIARTGDPAWVANAKAQLASVAEDLLAGATEGSDHQLLWAKLLGWTATTPAQLDLLVALRSGERELSGLPVDTALRWSYLRRLASMGRADDDEISAELERDNTDTGANNAAAARASIPDAAHKAAGWHLLVDKDELGPVGVREVSEGFMQLEHADLLQPYVEPYFDALPRWWESRGEHRRLLLGRSLFPYPAASPELLQRIDAFLAESRPPDLARLLVEQRDVVERALRSRALT